LLNLASIMALQPDVLILDEPTSQLDPIAASDFLETVRKINREIGTTVIIVEHRLEDTLPYSDRAIVMDNGSIIIDDTPKNVGERLKQQSHDMFLSMPAPMRIYSAINNKLECPLTVRDGRKWLSFLSINKEITCNEIEIQKQDYDTKTSVIEFKEVWFRYNQNSEDIIKGLTLKIPQNSIYCILGGNGAGKSTTLSLISRINKPYRGKIFINNKDIRKISDKELFTENLGVLPQNVQAIFVKKTVKADLLEMLSSLKYSKEEKEEQISKISKLMHIENLMGMHPYDLSGGEQQRVALAKVMLLNPKILLLDEPTKGMDNSFKKEFAQTLTDLKSNGVTIILVSHDVEFCAEIADRCALFFNGSVVTEKNSNSFFSGNSFYTTSANRMSRNIFKNTVTVEDVIKLCHKNNL
ncbi:MAG: ATP-binding cassette domain-containing protein, partial [Oscillospiraceae bacterium]